MNEQEVIRLYEQEKWTLRRVADHLGTNHHAIRRILQRHGIAISSKQRRAPMSQKQRDGISAASKGRKTWSEGLTMSEEFKRKNMRAKLKTERELHQYKDFEKLKLLTRLSSKHRQYLGLNDEKRWEFIDKFYFSDEFNAVYDVWLAHGKDKWWYPSLDHINPKANGGNFDLDNLRFITWFENRAKADMPLIEWELFKSQTNTKSDLFIEVILENYRSR